jgi:hypothetical protein
MLEVFKNLVIKGDDPAKLDTFLAKLRSNLAPGWSRDEQAEANVNRDLPGRDIQAFRWTDQNSDLSAVLFLARTADEIKVTNIVPVTDGQLTRAQYNAILDDFAKRNADRIATQEELVVEVTPDKLAIDHWLSEEAARRLQSFSALANKNTGSSHSTDFERWAAFLIQAHMDKTSLDSSTLSRWLTEEEGWPEERASDLANEFDFARDLLRAYDDEQRE